MNYGIDSKKPQDSPSQLIGRQANKAFLAQTPDSWIETDQAGDTDFGVDYVVQLKDRSDQIAYSFSLQLKGTKKPKYTKDRNQISYSFSVRTLNLYRNNSPLTMVAIVDLEGYDENRQNCPIYYKWLTKNEVDKSLKGKQHQDSITITLETSQRITANLDVLEYCNRKIIVENVCNNLLDAIERNGKNPVDGITKISQLAEKKPSLFSAASDTYEDSPWITNPESDNSGKLQKSNEYIKKNDLEASLELLDSFNTGNKKNTDHEKAECLYQQGIISELKGDKISGDILLKEAYEVCTLTKYKLAYFDSKFTPEKPLSSRELIAIEKNLSDNDYREFILKIKCLALRGRKGEALEKIQNHHPDRPIAVLLVGLITNDKNLTKSTLSQIYENDLRNDREKFVFFSIKSRNLFTDAIGEISGEDEIIPICGKSAYRIKPLKETFRCLESAWKYSKRLGYPQDTTLLFDISMFTYTALSKEYLFENHLNSIIKNRESNLHIVRSLAILNFNRRKYQNTINVIESLKIEIPVQEEGMRIICYHNLEDHPKVVELFEASKTRLYKEKAYKLTHLLLVCALSAFEIMELKKEKEYLSKLDKVDSSKAFTGIYRFIKNVAERPQEKGTLALELYNEHAGRESMYIIAEQLINNLDPKDETQASSINELSKIIRKKRNLFHDENRILSQSLITLSKWEDLAILSKEEIEKNTESSNWNLLLAYSFESLGEIGEANKILTSNSFIKELSETNIEYLIHFNIVFGTPQAAEDKLLSLISKTQKNEKKCSLLFALFSLYLISEPATLKLKSTFERLANLVDQKNQNQEGLFLQLFLTLPKKIKINKNLIEECKKRLINYSQDFPDSNILRMHTFSDLNNSTAMVNDIKKMTGVTPQLEERWKANANLIRHGLLPVPFEILGLFLKEYRDVFSAWGYANFTPDESYEFKMNHSLISDQEILADIEKGKNIALDITSILIMNELDIFDLVLSALPSLHIRRHTYEELVEKSHSLTGSFFFPTPMQILNSIKAHINKLVFINSISENIVEHYEKSIDAKNISLVCDDLRMAQSVKRHHNSINIYNLFNVISFLYSKKYIDEKTYFEKFEQFFNLGILNPGVSFTALAQYLKFKTLANNRKTSFLNDSKKIFNRIFNKKIASRDAYHIYKRILVEFHCTINGTLEAKEFVELTIFFALKYPEHSVTYYLTSIYIEIASSTEIVKDKYTEMSHGHQKLWNLYVDSIFLVKPDQYSEKIAIDNIISVLISNYSYGPEEKFNAIAAGLVPGTRDHQMLYSTFSQALLNKIHNS